jgi:hypothetical protein
MDDLKHEFQRYAARWKRVYPARAHDVLKEWALDSDK